MVWGVISQDLSFSRCCVVIATFWTSLEKTSILCELLMFFQGCEFYDGMTVACSKRREFPVVMNAAQICPNDPESENCPFGLLYQSKRDKV